MKTISALVISTLLLLISCSKDSAQPKPDPAPRTDGKLTGTWKMVQVSQRGFTRDNVPTSDWSLPVADKDTRYLTFTDNPAVLYMLEVYPDSAVTGPFTYRRSPTTLAIDSIHMTMPVHIPVEEYKILELSDDKMVLEMREDRGIPYYHLFAMTFQRQP